MGIFDVFRRIEETPQPRGIVSGITPGDKRLNSMSKPQVSASAGSTPYQFGSYYPFEGGKYAGAMSYASEFGANYHELRRKSRIAYWDSTLARSIISRIVDNAINTGLQMEAQPVWDLLGIDDEEDRRRWLRNTESRFHLWANSREPDAAERLTFYQLEYFAKLNKARDGEIFVIYRYAPPNSGRMSPLSLQFVWPEQVRSPDEGAEYRAAKARGNRIEYGIELTTAGAEVAYFVQDGVSGRVKRIPRKGARSGRLLMDHDMVYDTVGQIRGLPMIAHILHELRKLQDYQLSELEAAVLNALFAASIEREIGAQQTDPLQGITDNDQPENNTGTANPPTEGSITKPGLFFRHLGNGEKLVSHDTKRPNVNYEKFETAIKKSVSGTVGMPLEVLDEAFNSNYSAARAAIQFFYNRMEIERENDAAGFFNPVADAWMNEEVQAGRISAAGWRTDPALRAAWSNRKWTGLGRPSIDPVKEANAAKIRISEGLTTRERESKAYNGSEYTENASRLQSENQQLADAKEPLQREEPAQQSLPFEEDE